MLTESYLDALATVFTAGRICSLHESAVVSDVGFQGLQHKCVRYSGPTMRCKQGSNDSVRKNAKRFAKSGAELGAAAGGRVGPVTTGLASGLGGALGYLSGAAVDGLQTSLEEQAPRTDGGSVAADDTSRDDSGAEIPVTEE